jgi:hypothetical protein
VGDRIPVVEHDPVGLRLAFNVGWSAIAVFDSCLLHRVGQGSDLGSGKTRGNDKVIRQVANIPNVQDQNIGTFAIVGSLGERED